MAKRLIQRTKSGKYDIDITFYGEDKEPYFTNSNTYDFPSTIKQIIDDTIAICPIKVEPKYIMIFSSPSFECAMFSSKGRRLKLDPKDFGRERKDGRPVCYYSI